MFARAVLTSGLTLAVLAPVPAAAADGHVTIRVVVSGRLLHKPAVLRIFDRAGEHMVRVAASRTLRVRAGRVTIVPAPIRAGHSSTATVQQFTASSGRVVRIDYALDEVSRSGLLEPLALGNDGKPATGWNWVSSPDKSLVAFTSSGRLLVRNLATGLVTKLADGAQGRLSWSPDSTHIAFLSNAGLAIANVAAGDLVLVPGTAAAWSDDDHLVVSGRSSGIRIRTLSTGETRELVPSRYQVDAWRLAPDGRRLAFESSGDAVRPAIYVTDLAMGSTTLVSRNSTGAVWSPDSSKVGISSTTGLFIKDLGSGVVSRVSHKPSGREPALQWSPDGKTVAFRSQGTVFIKHLGSGRVEPLLPRRSRSTLVDGFAFSPSGDRIAFLSRQRKGCWTDVVPFANLNCDNVLVRDVGSHRLANVSTLASGLGWLGGPLDSRGGWSPAWLGDDRLLFLAADRTGDTVPVIKTVEWRPKVVRSPVPWTPPWCDPTRWWWSC